MPKRSGLDRFLAEQVDMAHRIYWNNYLDGVVYNVYILILLDSIILKLDRLTL